MHDSATWDPRGARELLKARYPRGASQLVGPLSSRFSPLETKAWFEAEGVTLKRETDGRVFPSTDDSATIVDALLSAADRAGVQLRTRAKVVSAARRDGGGFLLRGAGGGAAEGGSGDGSALTVETRSLLLATGSSSHHLAADLGHDISPLIPSLFSFRLSSGGMLDASLAGVSVADAELTFQPAAPPAPADAGEASLDPGSVQPPSKKRRRGAGAVSARGPLLVTHRGLSGPAALRLSSFGAAELAAAGYRGQLQLNLAPAHTPAQAISALEACRTRPDVRLKLASTMNPFGLPRRLWVAVVAAAGVDGGKRWDAVAKSDLARLQRATQAAPLAFSGKDSNKEEFVTAGGVSWAGVDARSMGSKNVPGLFFAGELLDVDGVTGGHNFQSCWTTGMVAGRAAHAHAQELRGRLL
jgi:predicted flavoprotein YhiN